MHVGQYDIKILKSIGQGRLGEVFLAVSRGQGGFEKRVAIKRLWESLSRDEELIGRFGAAVQACSRLAHPNVVEIHDFTRSPEGYHILVMEVVEGLSLRQVNHTFRTAGRLLPQGLSVQIVLQLCAALEAIHAIRGVERDALGLVHRNVRPANVMLSPAGTVKLMEVGLDAGEGARGAYGVGGQEATLVYRAPEQLEGGLSDATADQFAVGLILCELLLGRPIYDAPTLPLLRRQVRQADVGPALERLALAYPHIHPIVQRCLLSEPQARFLDVSALARALERVAPPPPRDIDLGTLVRLLKRGEAVAELWGRSIPWKSQTSIPAAGTLGPLTSNFSTNGHKLDEALPPEPLAMQQHAHQALDAGLPTPDALLADSSGESDPALPPEPLAMAGASSGPSSADLDAMEQDGSLNYWDNVQTVQVKALDLEEAERAAIEAASEAKTEVIGPTGLKPANEDLEDSFFASPAKAASAPLPPEADDAHSRRRAGPWIFAVSLAATLVLIAVGYGQGWLADDGQVAANVPYRGDAGSDPANSDVANSDPANDQRVSKERQPDLADAKARAESAALAPALTETTDRTPKGAESPTIAVANEPLPVQVRRDPGSEEPPPAVSAPSSNATAESESITDEDSPDSIELPDAEPAKPAPPAVPTEIQPPASDDAPKTADTLAVAALPPTVKPKPPPLQPAEVSFGSIPAARVVRVAGRPLGKSGREPTAIPPGRYPVTIEAADGRRTTVEIELQSGHVHRFFYNFDTSTLEDKGR